MRKRGKESTSTITKDKTRNEVGQDKKYVHGKYKCYNMSLNHAQTHQDALSQLN